MKKITSRKNPICIHLKKLGASSSYRRQTGQFLCDGLKLLEDAVKYNAKIPVVLASTSVPFPIPIDTEYYNVDIGIINSISPLVRPQGVLFSCEIPPVSSEQITSGTHILLDNLQDPGNVGTIIRTANALGIDSVMLYDNCADPYNLKTIRGSMGAIFNQQIINVNRKDLIAFKQNGMKIVGTVIKQESQDFAEISYKNSIIAIGNEGAGLSEYILSLCDELINIPMKQESLSLNAAVAAGIIMYRAKDYVRT
jgi:TrmH family RNA methyltransferase